MITAAHFNHVEHLSPASHFTHSQPSKAKAKSAPTPTQSVAPTIKTVSSTPAVPVTTTTTTSPSTPNNFARRTTAADDSLVLSTNSVTIEAGQSLADAVTVRAADNASITMPTFTNPGNSTNQIALNYNAVGSQTTWQLAIAPARDLAPGTYPMSLFAQGNSKNYRANITIIVTMRPHMTATFVQSSYNPGSPEQAFVLTLQRYDGYSQVVSNIFFQASAGNLECTRGANDIFPITDTDYYGCYFYTGPNITTGTVSVRVTLPDDVVTTSAAFHFPSIDEQYAANHPTP